MHLIDPEMMMDMQGLSAGACGVGVGLGALLWLLGWWGHRFWIVLAATVAAGLFGLSSGRLLGVQPMVCGLLLAVAAGMLALSLARIIAFAAGGVAGFMLVKVFVPSWDVPAVSFLVGGLAGLVLFRLWMMTLTSLMGTVVMGHFGLMLAEQMGKINAQTWLEGNTTTANMLCAGVTLAGVLFQFLLDRWWRRRCEDAAPPDHPAEHVEPPRRKSWLFGLRRAA